MSTYTLYRGLSGRAGVCLDADDACRLSADGHSALTTMTRSERRRRMTHVERHVLLSAIRATLRLLQLLLRLAVLVHRYAEHFLLYVHVVPPTTYARLHVYVRYAINAQADVPGQKNS